MPPKSKGLCYTCRRVGPGNNRLKNGLGGPAGINQCDHCFRNHPIEFKQPRPKKPVQTSVCNCAVTERPMSYCELAEYEQQFKQAEKDRMRIEAKQKLEHDTLETTRKFTDRTIASDIKKFKQFKKLKLFATEYPLEIRVLHGIFLAFVCDVNTMLVIWGNPDMEDFYTRLIDLLNSEAFNFERCDDSGNELSDDEKGVPNALKLLGSIQVPNLTVYPYTNPNLPSPVYSRRENTLPTLKVRWAAALAAARPEEAN
jgi:hypothetical protein